MSKTFVMKIHVVLQALPSLQAQRERLKVYVQIGKKERGKRTTIRKCNSNEAVCGNTVYVSESRGNVPAKR